MFFSSIVTRLPAAPADRGKMNDTPVYAVGRESMHGKICPGRKKEEKTGHSPLVPPGENDYNVLERIAAREALAILNYDDLLTSGMEIGYNLMISGAEIYRVEEAVQRVLHAYGVENGQVFAIPNCIISSMVTPEGEPLTQVRRIRGETRVDLDRMEAYNSLCRRVCQGIPPLEEVRAELRQMSRGRQYHMLAQVGAYCLCGGGSAILWGGSLLDGIGAAACGAAVWLLLAFMEPLNTNLFFSNVAASAFAALIAVCLIQMGVGLNIDKVIIGTFMALVPGLAITTAVRDIIGGDLMSGMSKLTESILVAVAIAFGAGTVLWMTMGV